MEIKEKELSRPILISATESPERINILRKEIYERIKEDLPEIDGFRKGRVPQDVAEKKFGAERLYKEIVDTIYFDVAKQKRVVASRDFKIYGDLLKDQFQMDFIAEIKPAVKLPELKTLTIKKEDITVTEEEITNAIEGELKRAEKIIDSDKTILENYDVAIIDYEGILENDNKPFKGGSAKNFQLYIDPNRKTFIDNFEEQMLGMNVGDTREIDVKFPDNYRDKSKSNKKVHFTVKLNAIKKKIKQELNDEFLALKGCKSKDEYTKQICQRLATSHAENANNKFKRDIIKEIMLNSEMTPIPLDMIAQEMENQWRTFLNRLGKTEEAFLKENKNGREKFEINHEDECTETIKVSLILEAVANQQSIIIEKEDIIKYVENLTNTLRYTEEQKKLLIRDLDHKHAQYDFMHKATLNERVMKYLVEFYNKKNEQIA